MLTIPALLVLIGSGAIAQSTRTEVALGVGPGLGWLRGNSVIDDSDVLIGSAAAVSLEHRFTPLWSLSVGAGYQRKGMRSTIEFQDVDGMSEAEYRNELDYLMIPLLMRASFGERSRLVLSLGPYAGYLLEARDSFQSEGEVLSDATSDDLNKWDAGLSAGLGYSMPLSGKLTLQAEMRYDKGLTDISALPVVDDGSIRTNAVCLLVGCGYRFGTPL